MSVRFAHSRPATTILLGRIGCRPRYVAAAEPVTAGISSGPEDAAVQAFYFLRDRKNSRKTGAG
jgi:hypothetical protein